jgi:hypothetical protein
MTLYRWKGKLLRRNGKLARHERCCCEDDCDPVDWGLVPTGHEGDVGDPCDYWTGTNIITDGDLSHLYGAGNAWPNHAPAQWLSEDSPAPGGPFKGDFSVGLTFDLPVGVKDNFTIKIHWRVDNFGRVFVNDEEVSSFGWDGEDWVACGPPWQELVIDDITAALKDGENTLTIECYNCEQYEDQEPNPWGVAAYFTCKPKN